MYSLVTVRNVLMCHYIIMSAAAVCKVPNVDIVHFINVYIISTSAKVMFLTLSVCLFPR